MNGIFLILFLHKHLYAFLEDNRNYDQINETNNLINNYHSNHVLATHIRLYKNQFRKRYLPLEVKISSSNLTSIFLWCIDLITEDDLYKINEIFEVQSQGLSDVKNASACLIAANNHKLYPTKQPARLNFSKNKTDVLFSKMDILKNLEEMTIYVFTSDFTKNLELIQIQTFISFIGNFNNFKKFDTSCVYVSCQGKFVTLTLPEYFLLGIWSFLKNEKDEKIGGNVKKLFQDFCY